jgi:hypothetical protein
MKLACYAVVILGASILGHSQTSENTKSVKPLFVRAKCDGQLSSGLLTSFRQAIVDSKQYVIISRLDEYGLNKTSAYVSMVCTEQTNSLAVASIYGESHCVGPNDCRTGIDGRSLSVAMCGGKNTADCGQQLYQHFVEWLHSPAPKFAGDKQ